MNCFKPTGILLLCLALPLLASGAQAPVLDYTATGWFSCDACAVSKVNSGRLGPSNRDCSLKCLAEGAKLVFLDEKAASMFHVDNPEAAKEQVSHYVRVRGTLDSQTKTVHVASVEVLKEYVSSCGVRHKG